MTDLKTAESFVLANMPNIGRDPTADEEITWELLEKFRCQFLRGGRMLSPSENQMARTHSIRLSAAPCWLCGNASNLYEASKSLTPRPGYTYLCPHCGIQLDYFVPLFMTGREWYWSRPRDLILQEIVTTLSKTSERWSDGW